MINIVLFGPPGAGKGTQSELLIEKYGLLHLSTGELFRRHISLGTDIGIEAKKFIDHGNLVPDELVIEMVEQKIDENLYCKGFIFDGFPRTVAQAMALDETMDKRNQSVTLMIALQVQEDELIKRILERGKTSGRSDDMNVQKINTRLKVYQRETLPVMSYYAKQNKYASIDGEGSIEEIFQSISETVDEAVRTRVHN